MADIYGMPVQRLAILEEATSMGAALVGGVGVGVYSGFDVIHSMNRVASTVLPDREAEQLYQRMLPIFETLYAALAPVYDDIAAL